MGDFDHRRDPEPGLAELVDGAVRKIVTSLVLAGALIGLAIYARPSPPHYQVTAADGRIVRINTQSGTVIACQDRRCAVVLERGQDLEDEVPPPVPAPAVAPALPAPQQPAPQAAPARAQPAQPPAPAAR